MSCMVADLETKNASLERQIYQRLAGIENDELPLSIGKDAPLQLQHQARASTEGSAVADAQNDDIGNESKGLKVGFKRYIQYLFIRIIYENYFLGLRITI